MFKRSILLTSAAAATLCIFGLEGRALPVLHDTIDWVDTELYIEINATDGDAGLQGFLDGDGWTRAKIVDPDGHRIFQFKPKGSLRDQAVNEVFFESEEPNFDEFSLAEFLCRFPAGTYEALGRTLDGEHLEGDLELTHNLPAAPAITSHDDGDEIELDGDNLVLTWEEVTMDYLGCVLASDIIAYQVTAELEMEVDGEEVTRSVKIDVAPDTFTAEIPADFLIEDSDLKLEIGAIEESGNRTYTELTLEIDDD